MINYKQLIRFSKAFLSRLKKGQIVAPLYLSYYYSFLFVYDFLNKTNFANSQTAEEANVPLGGTGNFPANPYLVRRFIKNSDLKKESKILDVGSGSGIVLYVTKKMGYKNLTGVEYSKLAYEISLTNLDKEVNLIHGNALDVDLTNYDAIFFFSPFRGILAETFFSYIPENVITVIAVNHDPKIEPILEEKKFQLHYEYQHPLYKNFNGKIFLR